MPTTKWDGREETRADSNQDKEKGKDTEMEITSSDASDQGLFDMKEELREFKEGKQQKDAKGKREGWIPADVAFEVISAGIFEMKAYFPVSSSCKTVVIIHLRRGCTVHSSLLVVKPVTPFLYDQAFRFQGYLSFSPYHTFACRSMITTPTRLCSPGITLRTS